MRKIIITIVCLFIGFTSQSQFIYFNEIYNEDYWSTALSILETDDGYIASGVGGELVGQYLFRRIIVMKVDFEGNLMWWKKYGEDFHEYYNGGSRGFIETLDGGYAMSGSIDDYNRDIGLLMKFDHQGDSLWSKTFYDTISPDNGIIFKTCKQLPDNGFIITGEQKVGPNDSDLILIRTDSLGNELWSNLYSCGQADWAESGFSLALLPEGGFLVGTYKRYVPTNNTSADAGMLKVDSLGNQVWFKFYGGIFSDGAAHVVVTQDGNYAFGSDLSFDEPYPGYPGGKVWLVKTDTAGEVLWERTYGDTLFIGGWCSAMDQLDNGNFVLYGSMSHQGEFGKWGWILKTDSEGDSIWMRNRYAYQPGESHHLLDGIVTSDNGIIVTGTIFSATMMQPFWIHKLDSIGCDSAGCDPTVGVPEYIPPPSEDIFFYPNPAHERVVVSLPFQPEVYAFHLYELNIYDVYGRKTASIRIRPLIDHIVINLQNYSPGLHIAILRNNGLVIAQGKFVVAR